MIDPDSPGAWLGSNSGYVIGGKTRNVWTYSLVNYNGSKFRTQYSDNSLMGGNYYEATN